MKRTLRLKARYGQLRLNPSSTGVASVILPSCSQLEGSVGAVHGRSPLPVQITFCPPGIAEGIMTAEMMFPRFSLNFKGRL